MTCSLRSGPYTLTGERDEEGYRTYRVSFLVDADVTDGPANVMQCPGLPIPGSGWNILSDVDVFVWFRPGMKVSPHEGKDGDPATIWRVEMTASNKPIDPKKQSSANQCQSSQIEDPLLEPPKVSGSYDKYTEEALYDRNGRPILTSSHELIRGENNVWDANRACWKIEQNVATYFQASILPEALNDTVNDATIWGRPPRTVKMVAGPWERLLYGTCYFYYKRTLEFSYRKDGWDRDLLDEGTKVLHGHWSATTGEWVLDDVDDAGTPPDPDNPQHFDHYKDRNGENSRVILNGGGLPAGAVTGLDSYISIVDGHSGQAISNTSFWLPISTPVFAVIWTAGESYVTGDIVSHGGVYYVAISSSAGVLSPDQDSGAWTELPNGITDRGDYGAGETYIKGDYVRDTAATTAGSIHVEKYQASNFLILGVPLVL